MKYGAHRPIDHRGTRGAIMAIAVAAGGLFAGGCYVGGPGSAGADDGGTDSGGSGGQDDGSDDSSSDQPNAECGPQASPLRRLTTVQYVNTVEALFPGWDFEAVASMMPLDGSSEGFENAASMQVPSPALVSGYQRAALSITATIFADGAATAQTLGQEIPADRQEAIALAHGTIEAYGPRIFRRPLSDDERQLYVEMFDASFEDTGYPDDDFVVALAVTFQAMMQAPAFLYIVEHGEGEAEAEPGEVVPLTSWEMASRLSYMLWDSMPDDELFAAAEADALRTPEQLEAQARRMLEAPAARTMMRNFHRQWLRFDDLLDEMKDPATHPEWSADLAQSAYQQLGEFVEHTMFEGEGTLGALLTSNEIPVDARIAPLLGVTASDDWEPLVLDPEQRRGVLTLPGILAAQAHPVHPSPVLRGVFIRDRILCSPLPPPPDNVDAIPPEEGQGGEATTNRQRYEEHVTNAECAGCHQFIDGIGLPFEHYDAIGAFRTEDAGLPVDASGELVGIGEVDGPVDDAMQLIDRLAASEQAQQCVSTQWFRHAFARDAEPSGTDACTTDDLQAALAESGGDIRELLVRLAVTDGSRQRRIPID